MTIFFIEIDQIVGQNDMVNILRLLCSWSFFYQIVGQLVKMSIFSI